MSEISTENRPQKVSVIVISYNARDELEECLRSLENQDFANTEVIIVNDASTDGTFEFLQEYQKSGGGELTVINNTRNLGVAGSRNAGIRRAAGDISAFTDADCEADRRWASELARIQENRDIAGVVGKVLAARLTNIWELTEKGRDFVAPREGPQHVAGAQQLALPARALCLSFGTQVGPGSDPLKKTQSGEPVKASSEHPLNIDGAPVCLSVSDGYRLWSRTYDLERNPLLALEFRTLSHELEHIGGKIFLDVACGTGRWMIEAALRGAKTVGLDLCREMLLVAARKPPLADRLVRADCVSLPLRDFKRPIW